MESYPMTTNKQIEYPYSVNVKLDHQINGETASHNLVRGAGNATITKGDSEMNTNGVGEEVPHIKASTSGSVSPMHTSSNGVNNDRISLDVSKHSPTTLSVCKNCLTSTTPLWRRDENGAVLCNACGLFLKLHGRPRPISLKTDVIKSRNRKGGNSNGAGGSTLKFNNQTSSSIANNIHKTYVQIEKKRKRSVGDIEVSNVHNSGDINAPLTKIRSIDTELSSDNILGNDLRKQIANDRNLKGFQSTLKSGEAPSMQAQLPHLSSLLNNMENLPITKSSNDGIMYNRQNSTVSSPGLSPQSISGNNQLSMPIVSLKDVLKNDNSDTPTSVIGVRDHSQDNSAPVINRDIPVNVILPYEEEAIRLKARINELELVTDLYKRHIFELDDKCKRLEEELKEKEGTLKSIGPNDKSDK